MVAAHRVDATISYSLPKDFDRISAPERHVESPHILGETQVVRPRLSIHRRAVRSCAGDLLTRFGSGDVLDIKRALQNARVVYIRVHVARFAKMRRALVPNFVFLSSRFQKTLLENARDLPVLAMHAHDRGPSEFSDCFQPEINRSIVIAEIALALSIRPIGRRALRAHEMRLVFERRDPEIR